MENTNSQLYQYKVCPFCWKARTALALKGVQPELVEVHPLNKKELEFSKDYKKVPVYVHENGTQVNDSTEIMKFIDTEYSTQGAQLFSENPAEKEKQEKWLEWTEKYVKSIPPLIYQNTSDSLKAFDYISQVGKFSFFQKAIIKYSGAFVMKMVASKRKKQLKIENPSEYFTAFLEEWATGLGGKAFMGGEAPDASDAATFGYTMSVFALPAFQFVENHTAFYAWFQRMQKKVQVSDS